MKLCIRTYTGTGNTARASAIVAAQFPAPTWTVDTRLVTRAMADPYQGIADCDLLIVAFSSLGFSA